MRAAALVALASLIPAAALAQPPQPDADRTRWFQEAKFGIFIHWGVYSVIGRHEWARHKFRLPQAEYDKYARRFNPARFDADEWTRTFSDAGARYVVITSKHHDGFSIYRSKVSDYDMEITPYKGDPLKSLADATKRAGLRLGFYHSVMDWHHPDYRPRRKWEHPDTFDKGGDNVRYVKFMKEQLRELLTGYGDVAMIWFDGEWEHTLRDTKTDDEIYDFVRSLQPNTLINDRLYERRPGNKADFGTPEQFVPATGMRDPSGKPILWEACVTINTDSWGYNKYETQFKTRRDLIRMLVEVVSKGGNLLLNVGPMPDGRIQPEFTTRLAAMGEWLRTNGEAIYGTTASPFARLPFFGRATQKGNTVYLHLFAWPSDRRLRVPGVSNKAKAVRLLGQPGAKLAARRDGPDLVIDLPAEAPDDASSVVALELDGAPKLAPFVIRPDRKGVVTLGMESAEIETRFEQRAKKESALGQVYLTSWSRADDVPAWSFVLPAPGRYKVEVTYAASKGDAGKELVINAGSTETRAKVEDTGGDWVWKSFGAGTLDLAAGEQTLRAKPASGVLPSVELAKIVLTPAR